MSAIYKKNPQNCEVCSSPMGKVFYDARFSGRWGNGCEICFKMFGSGLGIGKGQKYEIQSNGLYMKVGG